MDNNAVALAAIALAGTITTGFFALLNKLSKSIDRMTDSSNRVANEAEQRNAHLAELIIKTGEKPVTVQTVETQVVKEQK